jgi:hypothetical protein
MGRRKLNGRTENGQREMVYRFRKKQAMCYEGRKTLPWNKFNFHFTRCCCSRNLLHFGLKLKCRAEKNKNKLMAFLKCRKKSLSRSYFRLGVITLLAAGAVVVKSTVGVEKKETAD